MPRHTNVLPPRGLPPALPAHEMSLLNELFGWGKEPTDKKIASTVTALQRRHGEPALRYQAADRLAEWGTPAATAALLKRFAVTVSSEISDDEEKAYVAELIQKKGADAIPSLMAYLRTESEVGWPLRVLSRMLGPDEFRGKLLELLEAATTQFDPNPQRKIEMIHALREHATQPGVPEAISRFLGDTDDRVRIEACGLLASAGRDTEVQALVDCLLESRDRPRVTAAIIDELAARGLAVRGRKADVESVLTPGHYVTREGVVKRLGK